MVPARIQWTQRFFKTGVAILGINDKTRVASQFRRYCENFKYTPSRCVFIFFETRNHPIIPEGYEPKHLLWTLYFLLTYLSWPRSLSVLSSYTTLAYVEPCRNQYMTSAKIQKKLTFEKISNFELE